MEATDDLFKQFLSNLYLGEAETCFTGKTRFRTIYDDLIESLGKFDKTDLKDLLTAAYLASAGGAKLVRNSRNISRTLLVAVRGSVFHNKADSDFNYTALIILGHILIKLKIRPHISALFEKKYGKPSIWELEVPGPDSDNDYKFKFETAQRFPWVQESAEKLLSAIKEKIARAPTPGVHSP